MQPSKRLRIVQPAPSRSRRTNTLGNYQRLLAEVTLERLEASGHLERLATDVVAKEVDASATDSVPFEDPPRHERPGLYIRDSGEAASRKYRASHVDYFQREARNRSLGSAGEELVVRLERARLLREGASPLAGKVEWISRSKGDGAGFDVLSFETSGKERFIEVKTTGFGKETPFFVSQNEVSFSADFRDQYQLYRLFTFRESPRLYALPGALETSCRLEATRSWDECARLNTGGSAPHRAHPVRHTLGYWFRH